MTTTATHVITSRATSWLAVLLSAVLVVPLFVMGAGSKGSWTAPDFAVPVGIALVAVLINVVAATSVRTFAGPNGVTVHCGVFGWPRFHYPLERIAHAEATNIAAWRAAAWGAYWSPRQGLMLTLRPGPALALTLTDGRRVTVSTPEPQRVAALLARGATPTPV